MNVQYLLETADLCHQFRDGDVVLRGLNLHVPRGSIYAFLGPNGAGKTTTLRLVLGLLKKQQGTISIFSKPFDSHRTSILRDVGSLIESPSLYDHLTAAENLLVWQKVYQCPRSRISEVLRLVGLSDTAGKKIAKFSLGMKQRLSIAVALLHSPSLLILDEPTNGLDPNGIIEIRELLTALNREGGVTIVISSHLLAEIEKVASHVGIINQGRMVFQGTMDQLRQKQRQAFPVWFDTADNDRAFAMIAGQVAGARRESGKIVVPAMSNKEIGRVNRTLVEGGLNVHEVRSTSDDLEAIFLNLVRQEAR